MSKPLENLPRALTTLAVTVATILIAIYAFMHGNFMLMMGVVIAAPMVALVNNPPLWIVTILGLLNSNIIVPGMPRGLQLVHFLMAGFCVLVVARNIVVKPRPPKMPLSFYFIWAYVVLMAFIISQRGFGLRMTGGNAIGGASYVKFLIYAGFALCSRYIPLSMRQWKLAIVAMIVGSLVPAVAEMIYLVSGGTIQMQYFFIEAYTFGLLDTAEAMQTGMSTVRFTSLVPVASSLFLAVIVFTGYRTRFSLTTVAGIGLCILVGAMTGFRSLLVFFLGVALIYRFLNTSPGLRLPLVVVTLFATFFCLAAIIPFVGHLPQAMQRTLSFLPFADIDPVAAADANWSLQWRYGLWELAWRHVPEYLWVGRGFTVSLEDLMAYSNRGDPFLQAWYGHGYHNGILSALIDTGLPGLVILVCFMVTAAREAFVGRLAVDSVFIGRFHTFIRAMIIYNILAYFIIIGDVRSSLPNIFMYLAIFYSVQVTGAAAANRRTQRDFALIDPSFGSARAERPLQH